MSFNQGDYRLTFIADVDLLHTVVGEDGTEYAISANLIALSGIQHRDGLWINLAWPIDTELLRYVLSSNDAMSLERLYEIITMLEAT